MVVLEYEQVEIDHCVACGGIWLDSGELELLLEGSAGPSDRLLAGFQIGRHSGEKTSRCPICFKRMQKICGGPQDTLWVDKCRKGHGYWFDGGELERVIQMEELVAESRVVGFLGHVFKKPAV